MLIMLMTETRSGLRGFGLSDVPFDVVDHKPKRVAKPQFYKPR